MQPNYVSTGLQICSFEPQASGEALWKVQAQLSACCCCSKLCRGLAMHGFHDAGANEWSAALVDKLNKQHSHVVHSVLAHAVCP